VNRACELDKKNNLKIFCRLDRIFMVYNMDKIFVDVDKYSTIGSWMKIVNA